MPARFLLLPSLLLGLALTGCGGSAQGPGPGAGRQGIVVPAAPDPVRGEPFVLTLSGVGFEDGPLRWRLVGGQLPPGLGLGVAGQCPTWASFTRSGTLDPTLPGTLLQEVSGIAVSRRNPGIYWVHDDSGAASEVHALALDGTLRQTYTLGIAHVDFEDMALGPGPDPALEYLYVGDVGDNGTNRSDVRLLRMAEPIVPPTRQAPIPLAHEAFFFRYPEGPVDVEALVVDWATGTPYLLQKVEFGRGDVFRLPVPLDPAWTALNPVTAIRVTTDPPVVSFATAADASRDGQRLIVRTYFGAAEQVRPPGGTFESLFTATPCPVAMPILQQFEAVAYGPSGWSLVTTTERVLADAGLFTSSATVSGTTLDVRGVATAAGSYAFEVEAAHPDGTAARRTLQVTVLP